MYDIIIIGGGASGLICAAKLTELSNKRILLLEKNEKLGKKILVTGNGRCNLSNKNLSSSNYHSKGNIEKFLKNFKETNILEYFSTIGLETTLINDGYYPFSKEATTVLDTLLLKINESNITVKTDNEVLSIQKEDNYIVKTSNETFTSKVIVFAIGGLSSRLGHNNYSLLTNLGHTLVETKPALVALTTDSNLLQYLKGLRVDGKVSLKINGNIIKEERGQIQFNEDNLSGICIMNLSYLVSRDNNSELVIDLVPELSIEELKSKLLNRRENFNERIIDFFLTGLFSKKISFSLYQKLNIKIDKKVKDLTDQEIDLLVKEIKNFTFKITGTDTYEASQVTSGGVNILEVDENYESIINKDLFITGEVLDITGDCGGYNLHFAFNSGLIVADYILKKLEEEL